MEESAEVVMAAVAWQKQKRHSAQGSRGSPRGTRGPDAIVDGLAGP
jgi:hypothetical protein